MASRTVIAERAIALVEAELALPLEQRPNGMTDGPLAYFKSLVLAIERALDQGDAGKAQKAIKLLSYSATDGLNYDTELSGAVIEYLQAVDPEP